jgi:anaerobic selenocysteine-containing dehydrogenase
MPNSQRVENSIKHVDNIIYFGLYENETSEVANLVIPAKNFLEKNDIRTSYSHNAMMMMNKQIDSEIGISEYDLASYLCEEFDVELKNEDEYIHHFKNFAVVKMDGSTEVENRQTVPYKDGFDTDDGEFLFLEEFETMQVNDDKLYLITPKSPTSLNSQFKRDEFVYIHSSLGFNENEEVTISSETGSVKLKVKHNDDLREDCVLIYSGTKGVNYLTTSKHSLDGKSAIYQENKVELKK